MREPYQPPATSPTGPPHDRTHPHHSRTLPRHSREGGNPPPLRPHSRRDSPLLAGYRNRHNATESNEPQRKLVPARAHTRERGNAVPSPFSRRDGPLPAGYKIRQKPTETRVRAFPNSRARARATAPTSFPLPPTSFPLLPTSFPRRRESLPPAWIAPSSQRILGVAVPKSLCQ